MEAIQVAQKIEQKINLLEKARQQLQPRAKKKAETISDYEKILSQTILRLKTEGSLPATLIEKVARGECWKARLDMELADAQYTNAIKGLAAIVAELNGWQSINRHLSEN